MSTMPKYTLPEIERRWRVNTQQAESALVGAEMRQIVDKYLSDSQLRLRREAPESGQVVYKLCKKYGKLNTLTEPIVNIYLSASEYALLDALPGATIAKQRYRIGEGSLDCIPSQEGPLWIYEVEFSSEAEAQAYQPPAFVDEEITGLSLWSGAALVHDQFL
jgi:CYTH domain-containing protein